MSFKKLVWLLTLLLIMNSAVANESVDKKKTNFENNNNTLQMIVMPSVCVVKIRGEICHMSINFNWQAHSALNACLYQDEELIKCWQEKKVIKENFVLSLRQDAVLTLKNKDHVYAEQRIKVNASTSAKYRRRLRSRWSLF